MRSAGKSNFGALVDYLTDKQDKTQRVGKVTVTNCHSDEFEVAITEVLNTQAQNRRATSDKTYHLIVSFRPGEVVDDETLRAIEARICDGLGYGEHQRISVVHEDTDNLHIHIAINKIHPTRYTLHDPYADFRTRDQLCELLEREYGLQADNHQAQKTRSENRAEDMEHHAGVQSLLGWIKTECADQIRHATSWDELHAALNAHGLQIQERGNGLVITNGELGVKASSVSRDFSRAKLENRLGEFQAESAPAMPRQGLTDDSFRPPPVAKVGKKPPPRSQGASPRLSGLGELKMERGSRYKADPLRTKINTVELHAKYKAQQTNAGVARIVETKKALAQKQRLIAKAKEAGRVRRVLIKASKESTISRKVMFAASSAKLKDELKRIAQDHERERAAINQRNQRKSWADWLRANAEQGDQASLAALRARQFSGIKGNTVEGEGAQKSAKSGLKQDGITKKGTIIYQAGASAVRDDGKKLSVSRTTDDAGLQVALQLAMARYGNRITVNGTATFKASIVKAAARSNLPITFSDPLLERYRQEFINSQRKETQHDRPEPPGRSADAQSPDAGRGDRTSDVGARSTPTGVQPRERPRAGQQPVPGGGLPGKPNIGGVGRKPPPEGQNRLRGLSQLGVVHIASGGQVLLPGDVSTGMDQQGTKPTDSLRRAISGSGPVDPKNSFAVTSAKKYIAEREAQRAKVINIPKHELYNSGDAGAFLYAGLRNVDGQFLALLQAQDGIKVLPVDEPTAQRIKRLPLGTSIIATATGAVGKAKGRGR